MVERNIMYYTYKSRREEIDFSYDLTVKKLKETIAMKEKAILKDKVFIFDGDKLGADKDEMLFKNISEYAVPGCTVTVTGNGFGGVPAMSIIYYYSKEGKGVIDYSDDLTVRKLKQIIAAKLGANVKDLTFAFDEDTIGTDKDDMLFKHMSPNAIPGCAVTVTLAHNGAL